MTHDVEELLCQFLNMWTREKLVDFTFKLFLIGGKPSHELVKEVTRPEWNGMLVGIVEEWNTVHQLQSVMN